MAEQTTEARIAALESAVADLRRDLEAARRPQMRSMRVTRRCPACGGGRLLHCRRIKDVGYNMHFDLSLQKKISRFFGIERMQGAAGALEAYACRTCRLVEWHASTVDDVKPDGNEIVELTATDELPSPATPYR